MGLICSLFFVYYFVLLARVLLSWMTMFWSPPSYASSAVSLIYTLTEPVLSIVRRYVPLMGGFDLSPLVVFLLLGLVQGALC